MIKLHSILRHSINERKQVGTVYHFADTNNLVPILEKNLLKHSYELRGNRGYYISTTRDKNFPIKYRTMGVDQINVRIELDGDKLSDRYKVKA